MELSQFHLRTAKYQNNQNLNKFKMPTLHQINMNRKRSVLNWNAKYNFVYDLIIQL